MRAVGIALTSLVGAVLTLVVGFLAGTTWRGCLFDCENASGQHGEALLFWVVTAAIALAGPWLAWRWTKHPGWTALAELPPAAAGVVLVLVFAG